MLPAPWRPATVTVSTQVAQPLLARAPCQELTTQFQSQGIPLLMLTVWPCLSMRIGTVSSIETMQSVRSPCEQIFTRCALAAICMIATGVKSRRLALVSPSQWIIRVQSPNFLHAAKPKLVLNMVATYAEMRLVTADESPPP